MPTLEQLVLLAFGSGLTLAIQVVTSRINESHKVKLSVAGKRRERFYEKQVAAIGGCYERLAKCVFTINSIRICGNDLSTYDRDFWVGRLEKFTPDLTHFQDYFYANAVYLPRPMVDRLIEFERQLLGVHTHLLIPLVGPITPTSADDMRRQNEATVKLMDTMQDDFRRAMLSGDS